MKKSITLFFLVLSSFIATAKNTKILFVGNSYTYVNDLQDYASKNVMQMLIIGHSKIGKSTFAKNLATALNIEYID